MRIGEIKMEVFKNGMIGINFTCGDEKTKFLLPHDVCISFGNMLVGAAGIAAEIINGDEDLMELRGLPDESWKVIIEKFGGTQ